MADLIRDASVFFLVFFYCYSFFNLIFFLPSFSSPRFGFSIGLYRISKKSSLSKLFFYSVSAGFYRIFAKSLKCLCKMLFFFLFYEQDSMEVGRKGGGRNFSLPFFKNIYWLKVSNNWYSRLWVLLIEIIGIINYCYWYYWSKVSRSAIRGGKKERWKTR